MAADVRTVKRFSLDKATDEPDRQTTLRLPAGAKPLSVMFDDDSLVLWCDVDPDEIATTGRRFLAVGTDETFMSPPNTHYIGTAVCPNWRDVITNLTYHVYEVPNNGARMIKE